MTTPTVSPQSCPKWKTCTAPVCPLDPNYSRCKTMRGDSVCPWLFKLVKEGPSNIPADIAPAVIAALPILQADGGPVMIGKLALRMPLRRVPGVLTLRQSTPAGSPSP